MVSETEAMAVRSETDRASLREHVLQQFGAEARIQLLAESKSKVTIDQVTLGLVLDRLTTSDTHRRELEAALATEQFAEIGLLVEKARDEVLNQLRVQYVNNHVEDRAYLLYNREDE